MFALALVRLTPWEVVRDVPHDPAAFVTYALLALFVGFVWYGNRRGSGSEREVRQRPPHAS